MMDHRPYTRTESTNATECRRSRSNRKIDVKSDQWLQYMYLVCGQRVKNCTCLRSEQHHNASASDDVYWVSRRAKRFFQEEIATISNVSVIPLANSPIFLV